MKVHKEIPVDEFEHHSPWKGSFTFGLGGTLWLIDRLGAGFNVLYQKRQSENSNKFRFRDTRITGEDRSELILHNIALPIFLTYRLIAGGVNLDLSSGIEYAITLDGEGSISTFYDPPNDDLSTVTNFGKSSKDDLGAIGMLALNYPLTEKVSVGAQYTYVHGFTDHGTELSYTHHTWRNQQVSVLITINK